MKAKLVILLAGVVIGAMSPDSFRPVSVVKVKLTAYCPCKKCCGIFSDGKTATGRDALNTKGVAADPTMIPYGTWLFIPGIGFRKVDDTRGAMRQSAKKGVYHIDVRFLDHQKALNFGVQHKHVVMLKKSPF